MNMQIIWNICTEGTRGKVTPLESAPVPRTSDYRMSDDLMHLATCQCRICPKNGKVFLFGW